MDVSRIVRAPTHQKQKNKGRGRGGKGGVFVRDTGQPVWSGRVVTEARDDGLIRHCEVHKAHNDAIMAIVMAEDAVYSAARDKLLKKWTPVKSGNKWELKLDKEISLPDTCWSMIYYGIWLFCGLGDGRIRAFSKDGRDVTLDGHKSRCAALLIHEQVLLSGGSDGTVKCWQAAPESPAAFTCTHSINTGIPDAVTTMSVLNGALWVAGSSGVTLVDLQNLRPGKDLNPRKFAIGLLQFLGHMIVAYADGSLIVFNSMGEETRVEPPMRAGPIMCLAGLEVGPRLLIGHSKGQMSSVVLQPDFGLKLHWQAFEKAKVQCLTCPGSDGLFLVGAENGTIQLWQRVEFSDI